MSADLVIQICNIQLSISQKILTIPPIPSPVLWSAVAKWLFLSVPLYYMVRNAIFLS